MKSLKRTLSLVLALVMVLGVFGVAGAVDFTDEAEIQYPVAVGVVSGMGAIGGYPDGSFGPANTITRAEAAKMVAYTVLTPEVAKSLAGTTSSFTDVTSPAYDWAIPSIEYLVKEGAINGRGNGIFDPSATVTGYEMGKMLLCALGHGALDEYVGTGWDLQVAIDGNKYDIFDGRVAGAASLDKAATREEAALYCYNALQQEVYEYNTVFGYNNTTEVLGETLYDYTVETGSNDGTVIYQVQSVALDVLKTSPTYGKLIATAEDIADGDQTDAKFVVDSYEAVGHYFNVYGADVTAAAKVYFAHQLTTEVAVPVSATTGAVDAVAMAAYTTAADYATWTNYAQGSNADLAVGNTMIVLPAATGDADGKPDVVAQKATEYTIEAVTYTVNGSGKATVTIGGDTVINEGATPAVDLVVTDVDFSKYATTGGYVQVKEYVAYSTVKNYEVYETSKVIGVPVSKSAANAYTLDDGTVLAETTATDNSGISDVGSVTLKAPNAVDPTAYTFYLDKDGKYFAIKEDSTAATVAGVGYVTKYWSETGAYNAQSYKIQVVDAAGALAEYTVASGDYEGKFVVIGATDATTGITTVNPVAAAVNSVDATSTVATVNQAGAIATGALTLTGDASAANFYINENTVFVFVDKTGAPYFTTAGKLTVKTGTSAVVGQVVDNALMIFAATASTNKTVSAVIVPAAFNAAVAATNTSIVYVPAAVAATSEVSGAKYFPVYVDGVKTSMLIKNGDTSAAADPEDPPVSNFDGSGKLKAGFYTYTTVSGVADLEATSTGVASSKTVANIYNDLVSITDTSVTNKSIANTVFCDLRDAAGLALAGKTPITDAASFAAAYAAAKVDSQDITVSVTYVAAAGATQYVPTVIYINSIA